MCDETSRKSARAPTRRSKTIKQVDVSLWDQALQDARRRGEPMALWIERAFRLFLGVSDYAAAPLPAGTDDTVEECLHKKIASPTCIEDFVVLMNAWPTLLKLGQSLGATQAATAHFVEALLFERFRRSLGLPPYVAGLPDCQA